ncbi:uncharacterized protein SCDLUD_003684 [Saccharomycodes ludwigii]|uniref:uncharacterized protein n=1 Tax=Saccharomycodes ludwigii TaxID=36035 RepID=UPI001E8BF783|nr:hypothetical protein SCDLUD_003684 [Saccharomycodes ludwigii]KAH3900685.1 hypothetical protein SCDLUD_003684 [Saccharomycodes ludwigii]
MFYSRDISLINSNGDINCNNNEFYNYITPTNSNPIVMESAYTNIVSQMGNGTYSSNSTYSNNTSFNELNSRETTNTNISGTDYPTIDTNIDYNNNNSANGNRATTNRTNQSFNLYDLMFSSVENIPSNNNNNNNNNNENIFPYINKQQQYLKTKVPQLSSKQLFCQKQSSALQQQQTSTYNKNISKNLVPEFREISLFETNSTDNILSKKKKIKAEETANNRMVSHVLPSPEEEGQHQVYTITNDANQRFTGEPNSTKNISTNCKAHASFKKNVVGNTDLFMCDVSSGNVIPNVMLEKQQSLEAESWVSELLKEIPESIPENTFKEKVDNCTKPNDLFNLAKMFQTPIYETEYIRKLLKINELLYNNEGVFQFPFYKFIRFWSFVSGWVIYFNHFDYKKKNKTYRGVFICKFDSKMARISNKRAKSPTLRFHKKIRTGSCERKLITIVDFNTKMVTIKTCGYHSHNLSCLYEICPSHFVRNIIIEYIKMGIFDTKKIQFALKYQLRELKHEFDLGLEAIDYKYVRNYLDKYKDDSKRNKEEVSNTGIFNVDCTSSNRSNSC